MHIYSLSRIRARAIIPRVRVLHTLKPVILPIFHVKIGLIRQFAI